MFNFSFLNVLTSNPNVWAWNYSTGFNVAACAMLICALIPAYFDARKYQKTFFLEENFFKFFFFGASLMLLNAIVFTIKTYSDSNSSTGEKILFPCFVVSNSVSSFVNNYSWRVKRKNMAASAELGISEQEYWENHIAPTLEVKQ